MKRLLPLSAALVVLTIAAVATAFALGGDSGGPEKNGARQAAEDEAQPGVAAMCVEGVPDCNDMVVEPDGAGTEPCPVTSAGECDAVDGPPPIRSDEGIDPDECSLVHNIDACSPDEIARMKGSATFDITVPFTTAVTDEDLKMANEVVLAFDANADFLVQESFPPTGRASVRSADPDLCAAIEAKLESIPSVGDVTCQLAPDQAPQPVGPDEPVSSNPGSPVEAPTEE